MASNLLSDAVLALNTGKIRSVLLWRDNIIALCLLNKSLQKLSKKLSRSNVLGKLAHSHKGDLTIAFFDILFCFSNKTKQYVKNAIDKSH